MRMDQETQEQCRCCAGTGTQRVSLYRVRVGKHTVTYGDLWVICPTCSGDGKLTPSHRLPAPFPVEMPNQG